MTAGTTLQNILFNERYIGIRAVRIMAVFAAIFSVSYGALLVSMALAVSQAVILVIGLIAVVTISLTAGMAIVLWIINHLTRSYLDAPQATSSTA
ncbi:MAG: hypothetical protein CSA68_11290 [Rhodobacterales bacterium]|nr:MAG: hypothetical protein CSA68_11290 [Rhodobacterales bacterium]